MQQFSIINQQISTDLSIMFLLPLRSSYSFIIVSMFQIVFFLFLPNSYKHPSLHTNAIKWYGITSSGSGAWKSKKHKKM